MNTEFKDNSHPKEIGLMINAEEEKDEELQEFANKRNVVLLAFIGSYVPRRYSPATSAMATMNIVDEFGIETILRDLKKKIPFLKGKKAYLLVNSTGGSVRSAYKTAKAIRESFNDITVFVPHYALSGGTMLALIGNRIRMGMMSQLSPLDVQLPYNNQQVSVNSLFRAKQNFDDEFQTKKPEEIPYPDKHLVESLDPIILQEWEGFRDEGIIYLEELLEKSGYDKKLTHNLIEELVLQFPTHGYVIHRDRAKELGMKVEFDNEDDEAWRQMRYWLSKYVVQQTDSHFIRYVMPKRKRATSKKKTLRKTKSKAIKTKTLRKTKSKAIKTKTLKKTKK